MSAMVLAAGMVVSGATALAGPLDRTIVDPGAVWLVHVDVDSARESAVGKQVLTRMATERHSPLSRMECELGISPATDIKALTVFGLPASMSDGVVIFTTTDVADHLGEHLSKANSKSYRAEMSPQGVPVHVWRTRRGEMRAAVYPGRRDGERLLLMADSALELETGIRALTSRAASPVPGVMPAAEPREGSIVFFTCGDLNSQPGQKPPSAAILQASRSLVFDVGRALASDPPRIYGHASMNTDDPASAVKVQQMAQGILALLTAPRDPKANQPPLEAALMQEMAKNVTIVTEDRRCLITSDHDAQVFAQAIDLVMQKTHWPPRPATKPLVSMAMPAVLHGIPHPETPDPAKPTTPAGGGER